MDSSTRAARLSFPVDGDASILSPKALPQYRTQAVNGAISTRKENSRFPANGIRPAPSPVAKRSWKTKQEPGITSTSREIQKRFRSSFISSVNYCHEADGQPHESFDSCQTVCMAYRICIYARSYHQLRLRSRVRARARSDKNPVTSSQNRIISD